MNTKNTTAPCICCYTTLSVKFFFKSVNIFCKVTSKNVVVSCTFFLFHNYGHESLAHFFGATCICIETTWTNVLCRSHGLDISAIQSVLLHVNLSQPRQGFRYPSGSRGKASLVMGSVVKAFCCISGTMTDIEEHATSVFVVVSSAWAMSTINLYVGDMTPIKDTFWYQTKLKITLKIF